MPDKTSPSLEALRKLLETADTERVTKRDFEDLARQIIEIVKADKAINSEKRAELTKMVQDMLAAFKEHIDAKLEQMKSDMQSHAENSMSKMMFDHEAMMAEMQAKMDDVQDGQDADEETIVEKVLSQLPPREELEEETPTNVRDMLETLEGDERLDVSAIKGLKEFVEKSNKNVGGIIGAHAFSPTRLDATGAIDGSNATFAFAGKPTFVVVNGATYDEGYGWTYVNSNVVLDNAPPTGSRVYGIK